MTVGVGHMTVVTALGYYWQIAIPAVVLLTVLWYRWRGNRIEPQELQHKAFFITGMILGEAGAPAVPPPRHPVRPARQPDPDACTHEGGALVVIAAVLWVLAWAERSEALAIIVAVYLAVALPVSHYTGGGLTGGDGRAPGR